MWKPHRDNLTESIKSVQEAHAGTDFKSKFPFPHGDNLDALNTAKVGLKGTNDVSDAAKAAYREEYKELGKVLKDAGIL